MKSLKVFIILISAVLLCKSLSLSAGEPAAQTGTQHLKVFVYDVDLKSPIELARVMLRQDKRVVNQNVTNHAGIIEFVDIPAGWYKISVHLISYNDFVDSILVDDTHELDSIALHSMSTNEVVISGAHEVNTTSIDLNTGNQVFESETYHAPPSSRTTNLVQENMMGAARAPTGEVHVRGMHGEFTYYVDGIPVPLGVFGGLNEVVDPKVIDRATFLTGGFPAEYGNQLAAIIDVQNRVPTGRFHLDASTYIGSYLVPSSGDSLGNRVGSFKALNSNGQSLSFSDHINKFGYFVSGSRQETDRRIDPPVASLFHDHGFDYFLYGKFDYEFGTNDYVTANLNWGKTNTQVPFDSVEQIMNDVQLTSNSYQTLSYYHIISAQKDQESNLFAGAYAREGGLTYTSGVNDPPTFQFAGDTSNIYNLNEDRSFTTIGTIIKYDARLAHEFIYKIGLSFSSTTGTEKFTSTDATGASGPAVTTKFAGSDFGLFAQSEYHPEDWTRIDVGLRYDQHIAPDVPLQSQVSPRIKWNIFIDDASSAYLYFGRLFMPNNIEGLRMIASNVTNSGEPTLPERESFYEAVFLRSFESGIRGKAAMYYRYATPGVDDETVGSSAIKTPVNIETVRITGIEAGFSYSDPTTPFSGYLNTALNHAYGSGVVSGGFLPIDNDGFATDLDHDQRLSIVGSLNYQPRDWFANLTGIYGSGLSNGNPNGADYKTGLFDFNTETHTAPSWIFNLSAGYTIYLAGTSSIEPSIYITNIFDHDHLIKGAYFSAASYEERRNVIFKLDYHI